MYLTGENIDIYMQLDPSFLKFNHEFKIISLTCQSTKVATEFNSMETRMILQTTINDMTLLVLSVYYTVNNFISDGVIQCEK